MKILDHIKNPYTIVIIGGDFAGVELAERLVQSKCDISVVLVDKNNYNFFPPFYYIRLQ